MEVNEPSANYLTSQLRRTEAGDIPIDWIDKPIGEMAEVTSGGTPSRQVATFWDGDIPWVTTAELDGGQVTEASQHITAAGLQNSAAKWLPAGALLIALYGQGKTRGKCAVLRIAATTNQACAGIKLKEGVDSDFVRHNLAHRYDYIRSLSNGGSQENLSGEIVKKIRVGMPSTRDEQRAIADAINDADDLIYSLEQLLTKKRQIKQGAMQELLTGTRRLRDCSEWHWLNLGEVATLKARIGWQGLTTAEYRERGDYLLVTGTEFWAGRIDWDSCHYVDQDRYVQDKNIQLAPGDVLVTKDGTIGKVALVESLPMPATLNSGVFVIRPRNEAFHPGFFYYLLTSSVFAAFLGQLSAGSTINHLYQKDFVNFKFRAPQDLEEQRDVFEILRTTDSEIRIMDARLTKARALKQAMAQALLTGRIRLVEPNV